MRSGIVHHKSDCKSCVIPTADRNRVSDKPHWLRAAMTHGPGTLYLMTDHLKFRNTDQLWTCFTKAGLAWHATMYYWIPVNEDKSGISFPFSAQREKTIDLGINQNDGTVTHYFLQYLDWCALQERHNKIVSNVSFQFKLRLLELHFIRQSVTQSLAITPYLLLFLGAY